MRYMGGKHKLSKAIVPIITAGMKPEQWYVEPFCGGCNVIDKVPGHRRIAADNHYYLISMWQAVKRGWIPPNTVTEAEYGHIKDNPGQYDPALVGFVGFGCSWGGKWWGGYARTDRTGKKSRNYAGEACRSVLAKAPLLVDVRFVCNKYWNLGRIYLPRNSRIYCDPPYAATTGYNSDFDHELFWKWVRNMTIVGHEVYVSEYTAPEDFDCIWEKSVANNLAKPEDGRSGKAIERLFIYGG